MIRTLKIMIVGDFWRKKIHPKIRVEGKWLKDAGLGNGYVIITNPEPGMLIIRKREDELRNCI